ncbi:MAG: cupin domain-containing protein [Thermoleophilia bacterium]|nr:cupin domain-containing protein [Thermoleophilia bacterium]
MTPEQQHPGDAERGLHELVALEVVERLGLQPHTEGGYYRELYRSPLEVQTEAGPRPLSTAIVYLITVDQPSRFHRLRSDELWLYHAGAPAEMVLLQDGKVAPQMLGVDTPQTLVPAQTWLGVRVLSEEQADWGTGRAPERRWTADRRSAPELQWTLVSCVVTPGFTYDDFELAAREALLREYPQARREILALT